jgi:STE24 endopeptidase
VNEDKATRYHRLKRIVGVVSFAWTALLLVALLATGASAVLRDAADAFAASAPPSIRPWLIVGIYVVLLTLVNEIGGLPLGFYGRFLVERRYGLSNQTLGDWAFDQFKSLVMGFVLGVGAASILYFFIRRSVGGGLDWWFPVGLVFGLLIVGLANLGPVLLLPLFYSFKPLQRDALRTRLSSLADRAGARVTGVYEWGLGSKTKKANAALTGLAGTRRILVSDTMLADYSDEEIEIVLAHELAHHVHGDIWKGLVFEGALMLVGFFAASRILSVSVGALGLSGAADVAGLPLLLLVAGAVSLVMLPVAHAWSRAHERSADRFALELTRNPAAFISAMRRLGAQNLAEERPSRMVQWLFYSHPPIRERIATARQYGGHVAERAS